MKTMLVRPLPNHQATDKVAEKIFNEIVFPVGNFVLYLEGGLGVGKTYLVKKLLELFGVSESICSPTYGFVNQYEVSPQKSPLFVNDYPKQFAHFDFYRLEEPDDFFARGFQDIAGDDAVSCFVEWPDKMGEEARKCFTGKEFVIRLEHGIGVGMRKITVLER